MPKQYQRTIIIVLFCGGVALALSFWSSYRRDIAQPPAITPEVRQHIKKQPLLFFQTIDINSATSESLQGITGIGPVLAEKIITCRQENGDFKTLLDLQQVDGIGVKTVERLRKYCHVE